MLLEQYSHMIEWRAVQCSASQVLHMLLGRVGLELPCWVQFDVAAIWLE